MIFEAKTRVDTKKIISTAMQCRLSDEGLRISALSECLRAASYISSVPPNEHEAWNSPVSVSLTNLVRRRLMPLWPDLDNIDDEVRPSVMQVLNSLCDLGDMVRLNGGRWLAASPMGIKSGDNQVILLGGGPIEMLPHVVSNSAKILGRFRLVDAVACEGWAELWEPDEWIGAPAEGLETWAVQLLTDMTARLTDAPNDMGDTSVYLCRKWVELAAMPADSKGLRLCKVHLGHVNSYFIGEFANGRLKKLAEIESKDDARRFRFYLDVQANLPIRVTAATFGGLVKLRLQRRLPERESLILLLGWRIPAPAGEHPSITHHAFPVEILPIIRLAFTGLGITLTISNKSTGGN